MVIKTETYHVKYHLGAEYNWSVFKDEKLFIPASKSEVEFPFDAADDEVTVLWKKPGIYYLTVTETDLAGCTNTKVRVIEILPQEWFIRFNIAEINSCYDILNNGFEIPLKLINPDGVLMPESNFPVEVDFLLNNQKFKQSVKFDSQQLTIVDSLLNLIPGEDNQVEVVIDSAVGNNNLIILVESGTQCKHTIYRIPELQFAKYSIDTIPLNTFHAFSVTENPNYSYTWWYVDANGNRIDFESKNHQTENYFWDTEGEFMLFAQAENEKGCLSEVISKPFLVKEFVNFMPSLVALPDINVGYENALITGNVATNDFDFLEQDYNLVFSVLNDPPQGLVFFDDGSYEYQPSQGFTGKIHFSYEVCFEGVSGECASAEVEIRILPNAPTGNVAPVASTDAALTLPGKSVSSNLLVNDIDPDGFGAPLSVNTTPVKSPSNGSVSIQPDGSFTYTPNAGFIGIDRFLYQVCDNNTDAACDSAWVYIIVSEFGNNGQKPVSASDDMFLYAADVIFELNENDFGQPGENLVYTTEPVIDVSHGMLQLYEDGTFLYTPDEGYIGVDWFVYTVCNTDEEPVCRQGTGFIIITNEKEFVALAGRDTTIGTCAPYTLAALDLGDDFEYTWTPGNLLDDSTSRTPVFTPGSSALFTLTVTNQYGFETVDSVQITISKVLADAGDETFMYRNQTAVLDGSRSSGEGLQYEWTTTNGKIESGENTARPVVSDFGTYFLEVTDKFGCVDADSVKVGRLTYAPVANDDYDSTDFQSGVKIYVLDNDSDPGNDIDSLSLSVKNSPFNGTATVDYSDFAINYKPEIGFSGTDEFEYQICDTFENCDDATVFVVVSESRFFIPDAFSPNNDGINDYFEILGIDLYEGNSLEIFNRWGNRVYRADNYGISTSPLFWDGKSNTGFTLGDDDLPTGTYFYVLNLGNGEKRIVGSVYLDR